MSTHRGCKEMDIILGQFAQNQLDKLSADEIVLYERILSTADDVLYSIFAAIIQGSQLEVAPELGPCKGLLLRIARWYNHKVTKQD